MDGPYATGISYAFGPFRLEPDTRVLLRDGTAVSLPPRLYDTLLLLVENAGRVVGRDDLLRAVWHGRVVADANVKQTIFMLRKALQAPGFGERVIVTVPGRGYLFTAPVHAAASGRLGAVAAALEPPGPTVADAIRRRHVAVPVAALAAALAGLLTVGVWLAAPPPAAPPHSVAVLPFHDLSGDRAQGYFADGVSAELINVLARVSGLHVAGRVSAFSFRDKNANARDIGRSLHVGVVLEGSILRVGPRIHVTAELVNAASGFTMWAHGFDVADGDILQTQAEIASAVSAMLQGRLLGDDVARLLEGGTRNADAFDAYLRGTRLVENAIAAADLKPALAAFDRALALDPSFALALARRAQTLVFVANSSATPDLAFVHGTLSEAIAVARQAIRIAPDLAFAHLALGQALLSAQDLVNADREMALAHGLAPSDARIALDFALTQIQFGRLPEGVQAAREAAALDPLAPATYGYLAGALLAANRIDEARSAAQRARILGDGQRVRFVDREIALQSGDYAGALRVCRDDQDWPDVFCRALAYHGLGRTGEAAEALKALRQKLGDNGAFQYAELYAQWHMPHDALSWLQAAYRLHDAGLATMKSDPLLNPIRKTAEYAAIEQGLHFPAP
jgi:TolB-like protein/DNA-binding winged helix-turn-helix (wHTH) protein/tetratricopeptide (TPR) repeat protein